MSKKTGFKADHVEPNNGYETPGQRDSKRQVNGSENKKAKFAKPKTGKKMSLDERRMGYMRGKGLKIGGYKADLVNKKDKGSMPSKNKFKG